jgi:ankyrin repeat protein
MKYLFCSLFVLLVWSVSLWSQDIFTYIDSTDMVAVKKNIESSPSLLETTNFDGNNPLLYSLLARKNEIASLILNYDFNIDLKNNNKETALHIATRYGNLELISKILEKGPDLNILNKESKKAISLAKEKPVLNLISNWEAKPDNKLKVKIKELKNLRKNLEKKNADIIEAKDQFNKSITDLTIEIETEKRDKNINNFSQANKTIINNLNLIRQKIIYIKNLEAKQTDLDNSIADLLYLERKTIDELALYNLMETREFNELISKIDGVLLESSWRANDLRMPSLSEKIPSIEQIFYGKR